MKTRGYSLICFTALLAFSANLARAVDLTAVENDAVGTNPSSVATGDFDKDGFTDLVVVNWNSANISVLLNKHDGTGTFNPATAYAVGTNPRTVAVGDFNGDTYPDLAIANYIGGTVTILMNDGLANPGHFSTRTDIAAGDAPYTLVVGDFNGDLKMDLAVVNQFEGVSVLLGAGNGTFGAPIPKLVGANPVFLAAGNFKGAAGLDLVVVDMSGPIYLLRGNGDGTFKAPLSIATPASLPRPFAIVADTLNNDAKTDLAITDYSGNMYVLLNQGGGVFTTSAPYPVGFVPTSIAVGDFNGDGKKDLIVANSYSSSVTIYHGQGAGIGNGTYTSRQDIPTGMLSDSVVAGDFINSPPTSLSDVAVAVYMSNVVSVLKGIHVPPPPVNSVLTVGCGVYSSGTASMTATYNGIPMTLDSIGSGTLSQFKSFVFHLVAPVSGTHAVVCTPNAPGYLEGSAIPLKGVDQISPTDNCVGSPGAQAPSMSITTVAPNAWATDFWYDAHAANTFTSPTPGTAYFTDVDPPNGQSAAGQYAGPLAVGPNNLSWTHTGTAAGVICSWKPSGTIALNGTPTKSGGTGVVPSVSWNVTIP